MTLDAEPKQGIPRKVPVAWEALEDAFENNAHDVHSYLNLENGDVLRIVDGVADASMHARVASDPNHLVVEPVSSREQYRWMERYIVTVEEPELHAKLMASIDGKGAFRRFKDVLMSCPGDRERWFIFRSERLRMAMQAWLDAYGIEATAREPWDVPSAEEVRDAAEREAKACPVPKQRAPRAEAARDRLRELVDALPVRDLETALAFIQFLRERAPLLRARHEGAHSAEMDVVDVGDANDGPETEH